MHLVKKWKVFNHTFVNILTENVIKNFQTNLVTLKDCYTKNEAHKLNTMHADEITIKKQTREKKNVSI
jgi:hypothetical protein